MCDLDYMANNIGFQVDPAELNNEEVKDEEKSPSPRKGGLSIPLPGSDGSVKGESRKSEPSPRAVTPQDDRKYWYGMYPSYKSRSKEFKNLFDVGDSKFVVDFACAYNKDILHQGRMYLSVQYCCFYSNIFGWENNIQIDWKDVSRLTKEKTVFVIPNAIQIKTKDTEFFFTTFANRDSTFAIMYRLWEGIMNNQNMTDEEVCQIIMCQYPEEESVDGSVNQDLETSSSPSVPAPRVTEMPGLDDATQTQVSTWLNSTPGTPILDTVLHKSIDQIYNLLWSNSNFYFNFQKDRGTTELDIGEWEKTDTGTSSREVAYNMKMNNPVGPKTCQVKEQQQLLNKEAGQLYCIDTEAFNSGVPYADSFTVITHICAYKESPTTCRLVAKAEIVFRKELWGFLKEKIETNAWNGIRNYYTDLGRALESYREDEFKVAAPLKPKQNRSCPVICTPTITTSSDIKSFFNGSSLLPVILVVGIILCLTCTLNIYVLWNLYGGGVGVYSDTILENLPVVPIPPELLQNLPETDQDWILLLRGQAARHHQIAQEISSALSKVSEALLDSEKVLKRVEKLLTTELAPKDLQEIFKNLQKNKFVEKTEL
ncbi:GRAM domain-containing protein 1B [Eurytemora carolleeae]|uniref:GRAM domain-containing protein 1B n=1 Tax=Eurytemora carolleeae TaxID=1294199 RepID=UPI000C7936FC|nr:GRAM domain-containing protein 1B [Eurytemora carolleeae]|eukprot:XP_023321792.1 GRAM domain-containing protein 1B-like [Eurytemora affinis]